MHSPLTGARRNLRWALVASIFFTAGCASASHDNAQPAAPPAPAVSSAPVISSAPVFTDASIAGAAPVADPARVIVRRLGISANLQPLALGSGGELIPPTYGSAGWYRNGPEPGEPGRAVIAGHVDSKSGPDVFAALSEARQGDRIVVHLIDGTEKVFTVDSVGLFKKSAFPTDRVYGGDSTRELRLITCGGSYDRARGGYQSNVVVFATQVD
jgi:LPXTG-site transpeptidase (sortase) family protein